MSDTHTTTVPLELLRKYDRPGPRYTSYPTAPMWQNDIGVETYANALIEAGTKQDTPIALYVHIPFCERRCFYCGCTTCIVKHRDGVGDYLEFLETEIATTADKLGKRRLVSQLHFGGGTPTYLTIEELSSLLDCIDKHFTFTDNAEKSVEIDPRVTSDQQLDFFRTRGFNRVSLGVQDFNPDVQDAIGRTQSIDLVSQKLEHVRTLGYRGTNFDLIYGLPRQTAATFSETLDQVISLRPDRLAVYSFAYLPTVKANQARIDEMELPDTETKYRLFAVAVEKFTAAGYRQIGMDHFALPDDALSLAQSDGRLHRNFMGYTVQAAPEMIGFGMSSIGYVNDAFFQNAPKLGSYHEAIRTDNLAVYRGLRLTDDDLIRQYTIESLMCNFHLDYDSLRKKCGVSYHEYFKNEHARLGELVEDGLLKISDKGLEVTPVGRTFVRNIAMVFDAYLNDKGQSNKATFSRTI